VTMVENRKEISLIAQNGREILRVPTKLRLADWLGALKVRCGFGRMKYTVEPGLYGVGNPDGDSVVLVSANYKLSFDALRKELRGLDAWIMVLDTKGVNVWCAAGKGTFGTDEIIRRIKKIRLEEIVNHKRLIVPQLGAPGVAAHHVRKRCGFSVTYVRTGSRTRHHRVHQSRQQGDNADAPGALLVLRQVNPHAVRVDINRKIRCLRRGTAFYPLGPRPPGLFESAPRAIRAAWPPGTASV